MPTLRELADRTPPHRERHLDLIRAAAIVAVVIGHWLATVVVYRDGRPTGYSALAVLTWARPLTWLFQVMPLFFLVGGFANAASLAAFRRGGRGGAAGWLRERSARLVRPTTALLLTLAAAALAARLLGVDPELVGTAVWLASLPLWFLVAYLAMVATTPLTYALHRRLGLAVPSAAVAAVALGDLGRFASGQETLAYGNFLFGWLAIHQVGFLWYDGRLPRRPPAAAALLAGGLAALVLLTTVGPYPVSLVSVPAAAVQNTSPPSLALLALATAQLGLALLLREPCRRWLRRPRPWSLVVAANAVVLTVFLWHMTAVVLATAALHAAGLLPTPPPQSAEWLWWRVPWVLVLAATLAVLVALFARVERRAVRAPAVDGPADGRVRGGWRPPATLARPGPATALVGVGYAAVVVGLLWQAAVGPGDHGPLGLPTLAVVTYLVGAGALRLARSVATAGRTAEAVARPG